MPEITVTILRDDTTIGGTCPSAEVVFPASRYELADVLDRARVSPDHPGYSLTNYRCNMPGLAELLSDQTSLEALNLLAYRLTELADGDYIAYEGMLKMDTHTRTIGNLINLTYNLADCVCAGVYNDTQLGELVVNNSMLPELENIPDRVRDWLDLTKVGAAHREQEHGVFTHCGYVVNDTTNWKQVYPEMVSPNHIPELDTPIQGIFRVHAGRDGIPGGFVLPVNAEQEQELLTRLRIDFFGNLVLLGAASSIPPLNAMLQKYESFDYLNELATVFAEIPETDRIKFKAVLDYEGCSDLTEAAAISQRLDRYDHFPELDTPEDYGKWILLTNSKLAANDPAWELLSYKKYGGTVMERSGARYTPYGIVQPHEAGIEGRNN